MSTFYVSIKVGKYAPTFDGKVGNGELEPVSALVGSGASFTALPESLLTGLGVEPQERVKFKLRDGGSAEYDTGTVLLEIGGEQWPCPVIFGTEGRYILGRTVLAAFALKIDADGERLEAIEELLLPTVIAIE